MGQQHTAKFSIKPGGGITFEVLGGTGDSCTLVTKDIELNLSKVGKSVDDGKKPEFYESSPNVSVFNDIGSQN